MSFYVYVLLGFVGGIPAGMGMGGGTLTIPLLLFAGGVPQKTAQCANLFSFLPMSAFVLPKHFRNGLVKTQGIAWLIVPALVCSVGGSFLAANLPSALLKKLFGGFLIALAAHGLQAVATDEKNADKP